MIYRMKVVIPTDVLLESTRVQAYDLVNNEVQRRTELDLIKERRERTRVRMEAY